MENKSEQIKNFINDLYALRKESIAEEGEYGLGNLVFKEFRNLGYLDNLKDQRKAEKGKELSLEELTEANAAFTKREPMTQEEFNSFKENHPEFIYNETPFGVTIFKEEEQLGTYLKPFEEIWCNDRNIFLSEAKLNEEIDNRLKEEEKYIINEYRKYANIDENVKITEENLNEWALGKTSAYNNYDVHELKELLLRGE